MTINKFNRRKAKQDRNFQQRGVATISKLATAINDVHAPKDNNVTYDIGFIFDDRAPLLRSGFALPSIKRVVNVHSALEITEAVHKNLLETDKSVYVSFQHFSRATEPQGKAILRRFVDNVQERANNRNILLTISSHGDEIPQSITLAVLNQEDPSLAFIDEITPFGEKEAKEAVEILKTTEHLTDTTTISMGEDTLTISKPKQKPIVMGIKDYVDNIDDLPITWSAECTAADYNGKEFDGAPFILEPYNEETHKSIVNHVTMGDIKIDPMTNTDYACWLVKTADGILRVEPGDKVCKTGDWLFVIKEPYNMATMKVA